jgi:SAM-dependent methyltransferase
MQSPSTESDGEIDPIVQVIVSATCGFLYQHLPGRLTRYPIPDLRLPEGGGRRFLDVGCNWGRWCVAAHRKGYAPIGLDPDLGPVFAARRVCKALSVDASFVVGDARFLPFSENAFDIVFSYSVLQHFSKPDAREALAEVARVLARDGTSLIQMPNAFGVRSLSHLIRRGFSAGQEFDVRYWTPRELRKTFSQLIGPSDLSVDGFGGLGIQPADRDLFPPAYRLIVDASEALRWLSARVPPLRNIADSIYVKSRPA